MTAATREHSNIVHSHLLQSLLKSVSDCGDERGTLAASILRVDQLELQYQKYRYIIVRKREERKKKTFVKFGEKYAEARCKKGLLFIKISFYKNRENPSI